MYTPPANCRKLLCVVGNISEPDEKIVRAIFDSDTVSGQPPVLKLTTKTLRRFFPSIDVSTKTYGDTLSVIHEDGRALEVMTALCRETNRNASLALMMRVTVSDITTLNIDIQKELGFSLKLYRDNVNFEGHTTMFH